MTRDTSYKTLFSEAPIGLARVGRDGRWLDVNRQICDLLGYSAEELERMRFQDITHPDDLAADLAHVDRLLSRNQGQYNMPKRYIRGDGGVLQADLNVRLLQDENGEGVHFVSSVQDMTITHRRVERLRRLARHDPLTRILNRTGFTEVIRDAYRDYQRRGTGFAVAYLDLDGFKMINDTMGHAAGDSLLREVATRLSGAIGDNGFAARMGGDEFAVLLNGMASPDHLRPCHFSLQTAFAAPFETETRPVALTASIGFAHCPTDAGSLKALLRHADHQMFRNKAASFSVRRTV